MWEKIVVIIQRGDRAEGVKLGVRDSVWGRYKMEAGMKTTKQEGAYEDLLLHDGKRIVI